MEQEITFRGKPYFLKETRNNVFRAVKSITLLKKTPHEIPKNQRINARSVKHGPG